MAEQRSAVRTIHHKKDGAVSMYTIDAVHALKFRDEWSSTPWSDDGEQSVPIVEIPDGWQDEKPSVRIALAVKLGSERKGLTAAKADEVIAEEVDRRENQPVVEERVRDKSSDQTAFDKD